MIAALVSIVVLGGVPTPAPVPADVRAVATAKVPSFARENLRSFGTPHDDVRVALIRPVFEWSPDVIAGKETSNPVLATQTWQVVLMAGGEPVSSAYIRRDERTGVAAVLGMDGDLDRAREGLTLPTDQLLVPLDSVGDVAVTSAGEARPLDAPSQKLFGASLTEQKSAPVDDIAPAVSAAFHRSGGSTADPTATDQALVGGGPVQSTTAPRTASGRSGPLSTPLAAGAVATLATIAAVIGLRRRRRTV